LILIVLRLIVIIRSSLRATLNEVIQLIITKTRLTAWTLSFGGLLYRGQKMLHF